MRRGDFTDEELEAIEWGQEHGLTLFIVWCAVMYIILK